MGGVFCALRWLGVRVCCRVFFFAVRWLGRVVLFCWRVERPSLVPAEAFLETDVEYHPFFAFCCATHFDFVANDKERAEQGCVGEPRRIGAI